jgi:hypothetical protein
MRGKKQKTKWQVSTQSVYVFGREERLQAAYEVVLQTEKIKLGEKDDIKIANYKNRAIRSGIK